MSDKWGQKFKTRADELKEYNSAQELYDRRRRMPAEVSDNMAKAVSEQRRVVLEQEVQNGFFREKGSMPDFVAGRFDIKTGEFQPTGFSNSNQPDFTQQTQAGFVAGKSMKKTANFGSSSHGVSSSTGSAWRGPNDTGRQTPEVYSPLWLNSNLNLPRDRATINSWSRSFFALNPIVQNAISLHSTYPISKLNIKSKNRRVEKFFSDMIEEIDLMNICVQIAQEYWTLGEAFIYAELDQSKGKWKRLLIQNPDYVTVKRSAMAGDPIISLRPDENLIRLVNSGNAADIQQKKQLPQDVIEYVKKGKSIPLNNFNISHLARKISPYEVRGTGLIVSSFRQLMLFDKLRECFSDDTEFLTRDGWKTIDQVMEISTALNPNPNYVNGIQLDDNGKVTGSFKLKDNIEILTYNKDTGYMEYQIPEELHMSNYEGEMLHFHGKKVDCLVSPNHKMYVKEQDWKNDWSDRKLIPAQKLLEKRIGYKFLSESKWKGKDKKYVNILGKKIDIKDYLKFLGYFVAEGCVYSNYKNGRYDAFLHMCQLTSSDCYNDMKISMQKFADYFDKKLISNTRVTGSGYSKNNTKEKWQGKIHGKDLVNYFYNEIGSGTKAGSYDKKLPRWIFDLNSDLLKILLDSLVKGDGTEGTSKYETNSKNFKYSTVSKQLADDVYELAYKCGFVPNICISNSIKSDNRKVKEYIVLWSDTTYGTEPIVNTFSSHSGAKVDKVNYNGVVWCFTVSNGLFVTRRNGKLTIQGNSKYAQADNMVNPLTLVKIGSPEFRPTPVDLDQWRQVFEECYDEETEVLTNSGFKRFSDVIGYTVAKDGTTDRNTYYPYLLSESVNEPTKIACFNSETEHIEYHDPEHISLYDFDGEMIKFSARNMDIKVTPNHDMWVKKEKSDEWNKVKAEKLLKSSYRTRAIANFKGQEVSSINVLGKEIPIKLYLEFLGYLISEGSVESRKYSYTSVNEICLTQSENSDAIDHIRNVTNEFASYFDLKVFERIKTPQSDYYKSQPNDVVYFHIRSKKLVEFFKKELTDLNVCNSKTKKIPDHILKLDPSLLKILLNTLVKGDGSELFNKNSKAFKYYTSSKVLSDNIQELVFKCGYSSNLIVRNRNKKSKSVVKLNQPYISTEYVISWSEAADGSYPATFNNVNKEYYNGKVWCFTVPTGLFVTRRNGKITIQGNSQYDKDFKIFTHDAVSVERVGYGQGIYDISGDIQQVIKEIYIGLMVPSVLMDGTDTTYANGSVALDVLRQRYMQFRNMLSSWLRRKIFAPISKIQGFYDFVEGEKVLIVPEVDWNHMSLFDMSDHIQTLMQLAQGQPGQPGTNDVSIQTLYRSLGLEYEDERRKMRYEDIQETIRIKENQSLQSYTLAELRALTPEDEIEEPVEPVLPGESPFVQPLVDDGGMSGGFPGGMMSGGPPKGMPGSPPRPPMGAGGSPPKGPGGAPRRPGGPLGKPTRGPTGGGTPPGSPPPPV